MIFFGRYWKQLLYSLLIWILSISYTIFEIFVFKVSRVWPKKWLLTFRGHLRSKIFLLFESRYKTSYLISIDTFYLVPFLTYSTSKFLRIDVLSNFDWHFLSRTVFEIFNLKVFRVLRWPLPFRSQLKSEIFSIFESPCMTSYLTSVDIFYLVPFSRHSFSKFSGFDLDLWPLKITLGQKYVQYSKAHTQFSI